LRNISCKFNSANHFFILDFLEIPPENNIFYYFLAFGMIALGWLQWVWIVPRLLNFIFHKKIDSNTA